MHKASLIRSRISSAIAAQRWCRKKFPRQYISENLKQLMATRNDRFLNLVSQAIYSNPISPYRKLLRHVGCEFGDMEKEVRMVGLEEALRRLAAEGVFVTHDEMKGRISARRGNKEFFFQPEQFDNPLVEVHFGQSTSGSTGEASYVGIGLAHYSDQLLHTALSAQIHKIDDSATVIWLPFTEWAFSRALRMDRIDLTPSRWFSQMPYNLWHPRNWFKAGGTLFLWMNGRFLPMPKYVSCDHPEIVTDWIISQRAKKGRAFLVTYPSMAIRLCNDAKKRSMRLDNILMLVAGESITQAKRKTIESSGAQCLPLFGATEIGETAEGCLLPNAGDDMHLYEHKFALIEKKLQVNSNSEINILLFTTLSTASPKILLNTDIGDAGIVEKRKCGCPWSHLGFQTHLKSVWSYAKLTAEGMTLPGDLIYTILENKLPRLFGGNAGDYQLRTQINENGEVQYLLSVCPSLGEIDPSKIRTSFLNALSAFEKFRFMAEFLDKANQFHVVRQAAKLSSGGKSLPIVLHRSVDNEQ